VNYQLRLCPFLVLLVASPARAETTTLIQYDYEHDARGVPYRTSPVDAADHAGVVQIITLPTGTEDLCGVRFKVTRAGSPGRLLWTLGTTSGGAEVASGAIPADEIIPLYELFYGGDFEPQRATPGEKVYLSFRAERGKHPDDYYLVYGPKEGRGSPKEAQGRAVAPEGRDAFPLSFRLLTTVGPGNPEGAEERFEFVRRMCAPPYSHARSLRDPDRHAGPKEVEIKSGWTIIGPPVGSVVKLGKADLPTPEGQWISEQRRLSGWDNCHSMRKHEADPRRPTQGASHNGRRTVEVAGGVKAF